jgi:hypothetical protein
VIFPWIWRSLPGPRGVKVAVLLLGICLLISLLFVVVFPNLDFYFTESPSVHAIWTGLSAEA